MLPKGIKMHIQNEPTVTCLRANYIPKNTSLNWRFFQKANKSYKQPTAVMMKTTRSQSRKRVFRPSKRMGSQATFSGKNRSNAVSKVSSNIRHI
jgi:hypothetical protein